MHVRVCILAHPFPSSVHEPTLEEGRGRGGFSGLSCLHLILSLQYEQGFGLGRRCCILLSLGFSTLRACVTIEQ